MRESKLEIESVISMDNFLTKKKNEIIGYAADYAEKILEDDRINTVIKMIDCPNRDFLKDIRALTGEYRTMIDSLNPEDEENANNVEFKVNDFYLKLYAALKALALEIDKINCDETFCDCLNFSKVDDICDKEDIKLLQPSRGKINFAIRSKIEGNIERAINILISGISDKKFKRMKSFIILLPK